MVWICNVPPGYCRKYSSAIVLVWGGCGPFVGRPVVRIGHWRRRQAFEGYSLVPGSSPSSYCLVLYDVKNLSHTLMLLWTPLCLPHHDGLGSFQTGKQNVFSLWLFLPGTLSQWWKVTNTLLSYLIVWVCHTLNQLVDMWVVSTRHCEYRLYAFLSMCMGVSSLG